MGNDIHGEATAFEFMKVDFDGNPLWIRRYPDDANSGTTNIQALKVIGNKLFVGGYIWPKGKNYEGEWRDPNSFHIPKHDLKTFDIKPYALEDIDALGSDDASKFEKVVDGAGFPGMKWMDNSSQVSTGTPEEQSGTARSQGYLFEFDGLL